MTNSVNPDQMLHSAASDLGVHCLQRLICPNTEGYYSKFTFWVRCGLQWSRSDCASAECNQGICYTLTERMDPVEYIDVQQRTSLLEF